jgi:hypothetical protein
VSLLLLFAGAGVAAPQQPQPEDDVLDLLWLREQRRREADDEEAIALVLALLDV